jgi:hypothetical protein
MKEFEHYGDVTNKTPCRFCGLEFRGSVAILEHHADKTHRIPGKLARQLKACDPTEDYLSEHTEIVEAMRLRRAKRSRPAQEAAALASFGKKGSSSAARSSGMDAYVGRVSVAAVDEQFTRVVVKRSLPLDLANDIEFRTFVRMVAQCGPDMYKGSTDCNLAHRTKLTQTLLPALDVHLEVKATERMAPILKKTGATLNSDGWTNMANEGQINFMLGTVAGVKYLKTVSCKDIQHKTKEWLAGIIIEAIIEVGEENVWFCVLDGACEGVFEIVEARFKIFCIIDPTHSIDHVLGDFFSEKPVKRIRGQDHLVVDNSLFTTVWTDLYEVSIKFVWSHQYPLAVYRMLVKEQDPLPPDGKELVKYAETRYGSKVKVVRRVHSVRPSLLRLFVDLRFQTWLRRQAPAMKAASARAAGIINDPTLWGDGGANRGKVATVLAISMPIYRALRLSDGKKGCSLGKLYRFMLDIDQELSKPIDGITEIEREGYHALFSARWRYFHKPVMTAVYKYA